VHADVFQWIQAHESWLTLLSLASLLLFVGSIALIPVILVRLPSDYFTRDPSPRTREHPIRFVIRVTIQNLIGFTLLIAGILMLVLPGQGLLTLLVAVCLIHFPRKRQLIRHIVRMRRVHQSIDWIRMRYGVPPIRLPD
jgi:archaellum biogenesis protein FlaJ (TadC family)